MFSFAAVTRGDLTPIKYIYEDEVPPPASVQDAQQLFNGSDKDLTSLESKMAIYQCARLKATEEYKEHFAKDLKEKDGDLKKQLTQLIQENKSARDVAFRWELLTRAMKGMNHPLIPTYFTLLLTDCLYHMGMYVLIYDNALEQQQRAQLEAVHIYDAQGLFRLYFRHRKYPSTATSLAHKIYNSIPKTYIDCLQLMRQKRDQYRERRFIITHPQVTKADFTYYLEAVHKNDIGFLKPIGDLEVMDDDGDIALHRLFD